MKAPEFKPLDPAAEEKAIMDLVEELNVAEGRRRSLAGGIVLQLTYKFGPLSETLTNRVNELPQSVLDDLLIAVLYFKDIQEVENWLAQNASPS